MPVATADVCTTPHIGKHHSLPNSYMRDDPPRRMVDLAGWVHGAPAENKKRTYDMRKNLPVTKRNIQSNSMAT